MLLLLVGGGALAFLIAYRTYGRFLVRLFDVGERARPTPAHAMCDGRDYYPARAPVLFGHHFSSIAGAGPIVGPIFATVIFGWGPAALWIVLGSIFVGGVHDFGSLALSIKHRGRSIAEVARTQLSPLASKLLLAFIWLALIYVLAVFLDLTAATFAPRVPAGTPPEVATQLAKSGGSVATASLLFIGLAVALGIATERYKVRLGRASLLFVPLVFVGVYLGQLLPLPASSLPLGSSATTGWSLLLLGYCFVASIAPVWVLLQPRDYLSSFLLYACLFGGLAGIAFGSLAANGPALAYPAFLGFQSDKLGYLFPALFITIACGACSGFHSIVASGTTAKQLDRETDARPVGYGSMLVEGLLALVAVGTVAVLAHGAPETRMAPPRLFSVGLGRFLAALGIPTAVGQSFGLLALSTFLLTTLDTATRLARYVLQELFSQLFPRRASGRGRGGLFVSTVATIALPALFSLLRFSDAAGNPVPVWKVIWPVFGATNQLLGGLALMVLTVWLRRRGRAAWVTALPMLFITSATLLALVQLVDQYRLSLIGGIALALLVLALVLLVEAIRSFFSTAGDNSESGDAASAGDGPSVAC